MIFPAIPHRVFWNKSAPAGKAQNAWEGRPVDFTLKPLTPGEVARFTATERVIINVRRANTVRPYRVAIISYRPVGETCGLPPPRRYKTQTFAIPQSPCGASSLCSKEPFN